MIKIKNYEVIKAFGQKVRDLRISQKLSQEQLSYEADIPVSQVGRIERGEVNVTISTIYALSKALKSPVNLIMPKFDK